MIVKTLPGDRTTAGQLEQRRRHLGGPLLELAIELLDRVVERADPGDELAREPHLQLLLPDTRRMNREGRWQS